MSKPLPPKKAFEASYPRFIFLFAALYAISLFATQFLSYKIVSVGPYVMSAATFAVPVWYLIGDIITEIYGYEVTKKLIIGSIIACIFFSIFLEFLIVLPSPATWTHQKDFDYVVGSIARVALANAMGSLIGGVVNSFALAKWKLLLKGKYFAIRSLGSSIIGQIIFIVLALPIVFWGKVSMTEMLQIMMASLIIKIIILLVGVYPTSLVVLILKTIDPNIVKIKNPSLIN